ncbi:MAG TPA: hypothetical protein V6C76_05290 [Drouetiella sp.]
MAPNASFEDYHRFITSRLRSLEEKRADNDPERLHHLAMTPDSMLLRKWLLIVSCAGFPASFLLMFLLGIISPMLPPVIGQFFWILAKGAMGISFLIFLVGIYLTLVKSDADGR